jgi:hypothetical protein
MTSVDFSQLGNVRPGGERYPLLSGGVELGSEVYSIFLFGSGSNSRQA